MEISNTLQTTVKPSSSDPSHPKPRRESIRDSGQRPTPVSKQVCRTKRAETADRAGRTRQHYITHHKVQITTVFRATSTAIDKDKNSNTLQAQNSIFAPHLCATTEIGHTSDSRETNLPRHPSQLRRPILLSPATKKIYAPGAQQKGLFFEATGKTPSVHEAMIEIKQESPANAGLYFYRQPSD